MHFQDENWEKYVKHNYRVFFLDIATTPSSSKSTAYLPTIHPTQSSPTAQATMQQSSSTTQGISIFTIPTAGTVPQISTISPTASTTQNNGLGTNKNSMTNIFFPLRIYII